MIRETTCTTCGRTASPGPGDRAARDADCPECGRPRLFQAARIRAIPHARAWACVAAALIIGADIVLRRTPAWQGLERTCARCAGTALDFVLMSLAAPVVWGAVICAASAAADPPYDRAVRRLLRRLVPEALSWGSRIMRLALRMCREHDRAYWGRKRAARTKRPR